jgi:hypothetical protein
MNITHDTRNLLLKARGMWNFAVGSGGISSSQRVVPRAPKSLPGVREQLLSHRAGDTCKTSFHARRREMHFI